MSTVDKLAKILAARTQGPLKAEKFGSGMWAIYDLNEPQECRFDLLDDPTEGDAKFYAAMGNIADELLAILEAADLITSHKLFQISGYEDTPTQGSIWPQIKKMRKSITILKAKLVEMS